MSLGTPTQQVHQALNRLDGTVVQGFFTDWLDNVQDALVSAPDMREVHQLQGQAQVLLRVLKLIKHPTPPPNSGKRL